MAKKKKYNRSTVARNTDSGIVVDVRKAISDRLDALGKTRHWLAKKTDMRPATVYDYLAGKTDVMSGKAERMLSALGLDIRPRK